MDIAQPCLKITGNFLDPNFSVNVQDMLMDDARLKRVKTQKETLQ